MLGYIILWHESLFVDLRGLDYKPWVKRVECRCSFGASFFPISKVLSVSIRQTLALKSAQARAYFIYSVRVG